MLSNIIRLMMRSKLNMRWKLEPEQKFCVRFADTLRYLTLEGHLTCLWCHVANEGKRHIITTLILKAMGMLSGAYDYWFIGKYSGCCIEFKYGKNDLTDNQIDFKAWAEHLNIPVYTFYVINENYVDEIIERALNVLVTHNLLGDDYGQKSNYRRQQTS